VSTNVVALLLLTLAVALGVATSNRWRATGSRLFVTTGLHRNASLLAVAFLVVHVLTAVVDVDAQVGVVSVLVPVGSFWLAVGTLALDLVLALVLTSLVRRRLGYRLWRAIHWSAYAAWPLAIAHGLGMGSDDGTWWLDAVTITCIAAMGAVVTWRHRPGGRAQCARLKRRRRRQRELTPASHREFQRLSKVRVLSCVPSTYERTS
jgi:sulfoxide reductase heme-binding subunit YedZ